MEEKSETPLNNVSFHGVMVGNVQSLSSQETLESAVKESRGTFLFQPTVTVAATEQDEFFFKFGFAGGNALNGVSPFALSLWATDMEDDVTDINGRHRNYLLTAYYTHTFSMGSKRLDVSGGLVDATEYIGDNVYASDPLTQFMNEALVNGAHVFSPSYDLGGAFHFEGGALSLNGVVMSVGENDAGNPYAFYGIQIGANNSSSWGEGNVRLAAEAANKKFPDASETTLKARAGAMLSCDQEFGPRLGGWVRLGIQDDAAAIDYQNLYSGGLNVSGKLWGRPTDNVGIGHGMLDGGNDGIRQSDVTEAYVHFRLNPVVSVHADVQHLRDTYHPEEDKRVEGWVSGLSMLAKF
ncbi:MAG: carbohydrate porin [Elusimicrobia bacterium]|nr:carbohydrate porin [Elusimicrobiota bacterium]